MLGQPLFLGFKSVKDLVDRRPQRDQVYHFPVVESELDGQGMGQATHRLIISALLEDGVVGYVSFELARDQVIAGKPWGPDGSTSNPKPRIDSAARLTKAHLCGLGMEPIFALLARPRGYQYLSVGPDFMGYDKDTDSFVAPPLACPPFSGPAVMRVRDTFVH